MSSHRSASRLVLLDQAKELNIQGRHKMNSGTLRLRIQEEERKLPMSTTPRPAEALKIERCSACGSSAEHHLDYVRQHGLCVV